MPPKAATTPSTWCASRRPCISVGGAGAVFEVAVVDERSGFAALEVLGSGALALFAQEAGGHRWQRVPPTEKRGRVHTSTVTVAVLPVPDARAVTVEDRDCEWQATRGSGPGGQHRNKTDSAVQLWHRPSGLMVRAETERSQHQNRALAMALLRARLADASRSAAAAARNANRRAQIGSGQRGDKVRTIRLQDGVVTDHRTGEKFPWEAYRRGTHRGAGSARAGER